MIPFIHIDEVEKKKLDEWLEKHQAETDHTRRYAGAIGGTMTYSFTHTSIGTICRVKCSFCNEPFDFTNYDSW